MKPPKPYLKLTNCIPIFSTTTRQYLKRLSWLPSDKFKVKSVGIVNKFTNFPCL